LRQRREGEVSRESRTNNHRHTPSDVCRLDSSLSDYKTTSFRFAHLPKAKIAISLSYIGKGDHAGAQAYNQSKPLPRPHLPHKLAHRGFTLFERSNVRPRPIMRAC